MRLVSFARPGAPGRALGVHEEDGILHLAHAAAILEIPEKDRALLATMESLLAEWERGEPLAREVAGRARAAGDRAAAFLSAVRFRPEDVALLPPVAQPPTVRDFYAFETHVKNARARRGLTVPPEWYEAPVFYFSNPGALIGDGSTVVRPATSKALDYELEIAAVVGKRARDVAPDEWRSVVAGFTILNDWSARDVQRKEMAVGLGPAKGKDFATSLGPALVTLDELTERMRAAPGAGDRLDLAMEARVNGKTLSRANAKEMQFTFGQMIARASADVYLFPGDVIGSGTAGNGCLLELGPETHPWLEPGDTVTLEIERLGTLTNRVA
ncbi:MAG TPA: fumarylacetoacetate hydrolase family protein [Candidatus Omnitrophota bacterium]|jgi:fumarylacetoacetate (FAA) hydrolase|nr:fumarylacetoacetate hydrolase family protein [Candidatus Omnitrophota bacterium]